MLSKEEILKEEYEKVFASPKYDVSVNKKMNQQYILPAMDEYAKEVAIAFATFIGKVMQKDYKLPKSMYWEELFELFQKENELK